MNTLQADSALLDSDFLEKIVYEVSEKKRNIPKPQLSKNDQLFAPHSNNIRFFIFLVSIVFLLYSGWNIREDKIISPESGFGYALGVAGALFMFLLLLYPLRKKMRFMKRAGSVKMWFRFHMLFGVIGPVAALFHANFQTGSLNSTVVLYATLIVAASGIAGRYVYTKIHYGLYGRLINLSDLNRDMDNNRSSLLDELEFAPKLKRRFLAFDKLILSQSPGILQSLKRLVFTGMFARWTYFVLLYDLKNSLRRAAESAGWSAEEVSRNRKIIRRYISFYISRVIKISYFRFYERVFSMWHLLHLPLFFLLIIFSIVHVVMVHMF